MNSCCERTWEEKNVGFVAGGTLYFSRRPATKSLWACGSSAATAARSVSSPTEEGSIRLMPNGLSPTRSRIRRIFRAIASGRSQAAP